MKKILTIIVVIVLSVSASGQEILTGLYTNPVVREKTFSILKSQQADSTPIFLPFHDDFSDLTIFPSPERWFDREAFVNADYPVYPINLGVATLDAINDSGIIYSNAVPGPSTFIADHLTSRYIRLDSVFSPVPKALSPADSIYLSFYYQPQGRGLALNSSDSLSLEFLVAAGYDSVTPGDSVIKIPPVWQHVWASEGMKLDTFYYYNNEWFRRVMIPVTDPKFFRNDFSFRFYNHVSLASNSQPSWQSNADQWNIDEVYLNYGRSRGDTIFPEIRFIERPPSMLKNYAAMPYKQYSDDPGGEMGDTISVLLTNRDLLSHISSYRYTVTQVSGSFFFPYQSQDFNLPSYTQTDFGYLFRAPVKFSFPISQADSALFLITHTVRESVTGSVLGDTIDTYQPFFNYFAYDDGTPEQGYGLKGAGGEFAYRFRLNVSPDTLRAIRIYFNRTLTSANNQYFYLTVWNDNNNKPGDTLYSRFTRVEYSDSLNDFHTYYLENPVPITGTFYVGTVQTTDENLNIGFDSYNNAESEMLFNVTGTWQTSVLGGSAMIRPVIGKPLPLGVNENPSDGPSFTVYPNPAHSGFINISSSIFDAPRKGNWKIIISNPSGMMIMETEAVNRIDISGIQSGFYLVTLLDPSTGIKSSAKLIITR